MSTHRIAIVGGGAAGFFAAIAAARLNPEAEVVIFEKGAEVLTKVRISGGGRCNVTHACFDPRELAKNYPRGGRALIGAFTRFHPGDVIEWFESRGVPLKTEADGRVFPVADSSSAVIDCLRGEAGRLRISTRTRCGVERAVATPDGFSLSLTDGGSWDCSAMMLATGGCRSGSGCEIARSMGHSIETSVPSLFTFHLQEGWLREAPGVVVDPVEASIPGTPLRERGPVLITHTGVSGPVILRLSAWGARTLAEAGYVFPLRINWLPALNVQAVEDRLMLERRVHPGKMVANSPIRPVPLKLWERFVAVSGIAPETRWTTLSRQGRRVLAALLNRTDLHVLGKSLNKEEFVTCGGVRLSEVDFRTMRSRLCPRLHFGGEILDIDGITGGFNFQSAWTTGWIAGHSMAGVPVPGV